MKVHVPSGLYEQAKKLQKEFKKQGVHKPLYDCLRQLENGSVSKTASLEDVRRVVKDAMRDSERRGGWLG